MGDNPCKNNSEFAAILGVGRGRRPAVSTSRVDLLIEELASGQETIAAEWAIARPNISANNRHRLKEALGKARFAEQAEKLSIVARLTGLLPRVDSQGLLYNSDRQMHRWPEHWHSQESILMAPSSLHSLTSCGLVVDGGDNSWQPLGINDWQKRLDKRCHRCAEETVKNIYQIQFEEMQIKLSRVLRDKPRPEAGDMIALRQDSWETIISRVIHPLDAEEINATANDEKEMSSAWNRLLEMSLAQKLLSNEAAASQALDCLWMQKSERVINESHE